MKSWWVLEVQKDLKKIEKLKMVQISIHLGEVGFPKQIHKQIHQIGQYNGIGRLVLSCFFSHPGYVFLPELIEILICKGKKVLRREMERGFLLSG